MSTEPDEPTLRELVEQGVGDAEIATRYDVSSRTVRRWREKWRLPAGGKRGRKPAPTRPEGKREALLTVELTHEQHEQAKANARDAGYHRGQPEGQRSLSDWVRALVLHRPPIVPDLRGDCVDGVPKRNLDENVDS